MPTLYFSSVKRHNGVCILLADDDQNYRKSELVEECKFPHWIGLWNAFEGFAVMVLDSEILEEYGTRIRQLRSEKDLGNWCKEKGIIEKLTECPEKRVIVVLSGVKKPPEYPISRWYVKGQDLNEGLRKIEDLATKTKNSQIELDSWPSELGDDVEDLSEVIHDLHNLFQPLAWDVETLGTLIDTPNRETIAEIYNDYFGPATSAYLSNHSGRHERSDILSHLDKLCDLLPTEVGDSLKTEWAAVREAVKLGREALGKQDSASVNLLGAQDLQDRLAAIANAGDRLESALRKIRETKYGSVK